MQSPDELRRWCYALVAMTVFMCLALYFGQRIGGL